MSARPIVMLAQTPPPFHGQAVMTQVLKEVLEEDFEVHHVRMNFSATVAENKRLGFSKVWKLFSTALKTARLLRQYPGAVLYYPPAPGHWVPVLRDWVLLSLCRPLAGQTVFHFHARGLGEFLKKHRWFSKPWKNVEHAIVLGPSVRGDAEAIRAQHIHEIPHGIDVPSHSNQSIENNVPVILFVGFHTESKGIFDVLETARVLKQRGVAFQMRMAGEWADEPTRRRFEAARAEYGLLEVVVCLGRLEGVALWDEYATADVFFFPTFFEHETFGVVLVEAMAYGVPAVSTHWPGPMDVVRDGQTGFLCQPHDVETFADSLQRLIENAPLRAEMGAAAEALYNEKYSLAVYSGNSKKIFVEMCRYGG